MEEGTVLGARGSHLVPHAEALAAPWSGLGRALTRVLSDLLDEAELAAEGDAEGARERQRAEGVAAVLRCIALALSVPGAQLSAPLLRSAGRAGLWAWSRLSGSVLSMPVPAAVDAVLGAAVCVVARGAAANAATTGPLGSSVEGSAAALDARVAPASALFRVLVGVLAAEVERWRPVERGRRRRLLALCWRARWHTCACGGVRTGQRLRRGPRSARCVEQRAGC